MFTVITDYWIGSELVVTYTVSGTASAADYGELLSGSVTIPADTNYVLLPITPVDDELAELDETVIVTITPSENYGIMGSPEATVTILDNGDSNPAPHGKNADFVSTQELPAAITDEIISVDVQRGDVLFDFAAWTGFGSYYDWPGFDESAVSSVVLPEWRSSENAKPIVVTNWRVPNPRPDSVVAQLTLGGVAGTAVSYTTANVNPGEPVRIALQADATTLPTGHYPYSLTITSQYPSSSTTETITGATEVINRKNSEFGSGWWVPGLDRLLITELPDDQREATLIRGDGTAAFFANDNGSFVTPPGSFLTLAGGGAASNYWLMDSGTRSPSSTLPAVCGVASIGTGTRPLSITPTLMAMAGWTNFPR